MKSILNIGWKFPAVPMHNKIRIFNKLRYPHDERTRAIGFIAGKYIYHEIYDSYLYKPESMIIHLSPGPRATVEYKEMGT